jgi:hypothetical protein
VLSGLAKSSTAKRARKFSISPLEKNQHALQQYQRGLCQRSAAFG